MKNSNTDSTPTIRLEGISKSFGPVKANSDIHLSIRAGKIKALLGENGAGKSTLMRMLAGRMQPDAGNIYLDGKRRVFSSSKDAINAGIGMVYQHFMLVEAMSVAENVFLGQEPGFFLNLGQMREKVEKLAKQYGLDIDPAAKVSDLSMGEKQRVEILRLLLRQSRILIFDEPTAVLTPPESEQLFKALRQMAQQEKAIVFISHKLAEVMAVADEISILRKGEVIHDVDAGEVSSKGELARLMVGREVLLEVEKKPVEPGPVALEIDNLDTPPLKGIRFSLRQGEILGVVGVAGNGQKALVEAICGLTSVSSPESVKIMGRASCFHYAGVSKGAALSYIPEDRLGLATCPSMNLVDNFLLTTRRGFSNGPWLQREKAAGETGLTVKTFDVRPLNTAIRAKQLSGGNLQKMVLGREFYRQPGLIVAEQPTQGLDIAATEEVWKHLINARETAGILLVTGDLAEALTLSDRIAVMFDGDILDIFPVSDTKKREQIGLMMAGIKPSEKADSD